MANNQAAQPKEEELLILCMSFGDSFEEELDGPC